ncbi:hypothetical protein NQZ68_042194 [Dissostichus eleginoides]|nr:hypothetical protein NQZ68_042194 [Dissostichus eleginoides]
MFYVPIANTSPTPLPCPLHTERQNTFSFGGGALRRPTGPCEQEQLNCPADFPDISITGGIRGENKEHIL